MGVEQVETIRRGIHRFLVSEEDAGPLTIEQEEYSSIDSLTHRQLSKKLGIKLPKGGTCAVQLGGDELYYCGEATSVESATEDDFKQGLSRGIKIV